jgi:hypothetical protein
MILVTKTLNPLTNLVEVKPKGISCSYTAYLKYYTQLTPQELSPQGLQHL